MTREQKHAAKKKKHRKVLRAGLPLDRVADQTLTTTLRTLFECGYSQNAIVDRVSALARESKSRFRRPPEENRASRDDWVQIVTLWSLDPNYVDEDGQPRALPVYGPAPSVEALLKRVDSRLSPSEVCDQLLAKGVARRVGEQLAVNAHAPIVFDPGTPEQSAYHLQMLHSVTRNIEHNSSPANGAVWVERQAICHNFPESALPAYSTDTRKRAQAFLEVEDATMHRIATVTASNGRTVRATVHILFSARETGVPPDSSSATAQEPPQRGRVVKSTPTHTRTGRKARP